MLQNLQTPDPAQDPMKAVEALRQWGRWMRRSEDINLAKPDPTVLARGLTTIVQPVLNKNYEANFRTSLIRSTLRIDTSPNYINVMDYLNHLLAEMESLATGSGSSTTTAPAQGTTSTSTPTSTTPKVREFRTRNNVDLNMTQPLTSTTATPSVGTEEDKGTKRASTPCRYFGRTAKGCIRASKCPFLHDWKDLDKKDRCLACGGKGHMARECPTKAKGPKGAPTSSNSTSRPTSPTSSTTATRTVRIDESKNEMREASAQPEPSSSSMAAPTTELKDMLAEAGKVLKALSATHLKSLHLEQPDCVKDPGEKKEQIDQEPTVEFSGLLDSGASNPLRRATKGELDSSTQVAVTLAGEDTRILNQTPLGTIIVPDANGANIQPIVPLGALIHDLGCKLSWSRSSLRLVHPKHGELKVTVRNKCPEVAVTEALGLICELELKELERLNAQVKTMSARLEMLQNEEVKPWSELLKDFLRTGKSEVMWKALMKCPFTKDLPVEVLELVCEGFDPDDGMTYLKSLPLTRRQRKRLLSSNAWVVHLFAGEPSEPRDPLRVVEKSGKVLLEVDVMNSKMWDLHRPNGVFQLLLWAAASRRIDDVIGGPPCRTYSALLHRPREGYPTPARSSAFPHGVPGLDHRRQMMVHGDTALAVKQLVIWTLSHYARAQTFVGFFMEHPRDPATYMRSKDDDQVPDYPSLWRMTFWQNFMDHFNMMKVTFDQGALGHLAKKPTTAGTNYRALKSLDGMVGTSIGLTSAMALSSYQLARWAPGLRRRLADAVCSGGNDNVSVEELDAIITKKLSSGERELWRRHLENDHQPYRHDCSVCLNARGTGKPHRRIARPTAFSLALDTAGPFKHRGRDLDHADYRYLLVGAYKFPKNFLDKQLAEDLAEAIHVPEEDGGLVDDWFQEEPESPKAAVMEGEWEDNEVEPKEDGAKSDDTPDEKGVTEEDFEKEVMSLKEPVEFATIYVTRPLRRRTGPATLTAVQDMVLQLRKAGLPVRNVHSDRAREFHTIQFRSWLSEQQISQTRTSGADPAGNSTAENGVKWFKSRTRALLKRAEVFPSEWPMAAQHAAARLWRQAFPTTNLYPSSMASFGQVIWFKAKAYKGVKEKKSDSIVNKDLPVRWKKGYYRGPSMEVSEGHILAREDGGLTVARSVRASVVEPHLVEPPLLPELQIDDNDGEEDKPARYRMRFKTSVKMLSVGEVVSDDLEIEEELEEVEERNVQDLYINQLQEENVRSSVEVSTSSQQLRRSLMKAEVQVTPDIEKVLQYHQEQNIPLQVTHTVALEDVKANLPMWKPAAVKEYNNLKNSKEAFDVVKRKDLPSGCRVLPGKAVFTVKPDAGGFRRKARFVACGNYVPQGENVTELFAAGLDATSLRTMLAWTAPKVKNDEWIVGSTDVRQAFVLAPWIGGPVAIQPPSISTKMGLSEADDLWLIKKSIYGLREAPAVWAKFRDQELKKARWSVTIHGETVECSLRQLAADSQVWRMIDDQTNETYGYLMVYVDDILMIADPTVLNAFYKWVAEKWECDELGVLTKDSPLRFLGMELYKTDEGYELAQRGFITELLRAHNHGGKRSLSQGARDLWLLTIEEEEAMMNAAFLPAAPETPALKEAQKRVGELMWLTTRTRPDIQYAVSIMASRVTRAPELVNQLGTRLLDYLNETADYRMTFKGLGRTDIIEVYTDSSFSPSSGRSHGAVGIFYLNSPITWRSSRQQLVTLSTAESELIEGIEGTLMGYSVKDLIVELSGKDPGIELHIDNQAALSLLQGSSGSWRTRHLRLRSSWIRERVTEGEVTTVHEPGDTQRADIGTKPLSKERLSNLITLWGMRKASSPTPTIAACTTSSAPRTSGWLRCLVCLSNVCGTLSRSLNSMPSSSSTTTDGIEVSFVWDFYVFVLVVVVGSIALWEISRRTVTSRLARLHDAAQASQAAELERRLDRRELDEFQSLLAQDPGSLTIDEAERLLHLRVRFGNGEVARQRRSSARTLQAQEHGTSSTTSSTTRLAATRLARGSSGRAAPVLQQMRQTAEGSIALGPETSTGIDDHLVAPEAVAPPTSTSLTATRTTSTKVDASTQTREPVFELLTPLNPPAPVVHIQRVTHPGPYFQVPGREHVHMYRNCWGLRNASRIQSLTLCRCCGENEGRQLYG